MSYIRFGWGLNHVKGKSDSYIIHDGIGIVNYGLGNLGMMELLCDAIDEHWKDDKDFADWFKKAVAKRLDVELRDKPITHEQSHDILMGKIHPETLKRLKTKRSKQ